MHRRAFVDTLARTGVLAACGFSLTVQGQDTKDAPEDKRKKVHVLPLSYSKESATEFPEWVKKLKDQGLGNALWQEIEELLFGHPRFRMVTSPLQEDEFRKILSAHAQKEESTTWDKYVLPDYVITLNCNFFVRTTEKLKFTTVEKKSIFDATLYLRYYDIKGGKFNEPVPGSGSASNPEPMKAARQAVRLGMNELLSRIKD